MLNLTRHGFAASIGSLGKYPEEKDVIGVHVRNTTLTNTTNGVRIKTYPGARQLQASDIIFEDIIVNNVKNPIIIDQNYGSHKVIKVIKPLVLIAPTLPILFGVSLMCVFYLDQPSSVKVSDVHFKNIRGTTISDVAVLLLCSSSNPCDQVELSDINLSYAGTPLRNKNMTSSCTNAKPTFSGTQNPPACQ